MITVMMMMTMMMMMIQVVMALLLKHETIDRPHPCCPWRVTG